MATNYSALRNAGILTPVANTDLGSPTNKYSNLYMSGNISLNGTTLNSTNAVAPRIGSISYGSGAQADDTATDTAGGATITINGSGFNYGASVYISGVIVSVVSVVGPTQITFVSPAKTAGNYSLAVVNPDGASALYVAGLQYSGIPAWTTAAGDLGAYTQGTSFSTTFAATSDSTVTYSIASGSLPSGITLNSSTGVVSGTLPMVTVSTTYNFTVRATDAEKQDTDRNFSVNVAPAPPTGQAAYTTPGTYIWTVPGGVTTVSVVAVGAGGGGAGLNAGVNGTNGENSSFGTAVIAGGGAGGTQYTGGAGGTVIAGTGGAGGAGSRGGSSGGGGGAGGYSGPGGAAAVSGDSSAAPAGGGGAGGSQPSAANYNYTWGTAGGGVGILGQGSSGSGTVTYGDSSKSAGGGGSGGGYGGGSFGMPNNGGGGGGGGGALAYANNIAVTPGSTVTVVVGSRGTYGGGSGDGAVRIIWGTGRAFPSTLTTDQ